MDDSPDIGPNLLVLQLSDDVSGCEIEAVEGSVAQYLRSSRPLRPEEIKQVQEASCVRHQVNELDDLDPELLSELLGDKRFKYVYICGHGNKYGVGESLETCANPLTIGWPDVGNAVCNYLSEEETIIFLSCCRGGLSHVAYDLFLACDDAKIVVGAEGRAMPYELQLAFQLLVFGIEHKRDDARTALDRMRSAVGHPFQLVLRDQIEYGVDYSHYRSNGQWEKYCPSRQASITGEALKNVLDLVDIPDWVDQEKVMKILEDQGAT